MRKEARCAMHRASSRQPLSGPDGGRVSRSQALPPVAVSSAKRTRVRIALPVPPLGV
ncbi:hypothetical protein P3T29_000682 [Kitasatospora sp. MAP5-34]|nr:hypothetical protein [Kitasatospora sp. MAP5-34]